MHKLKSGIEILSQTKRLYNSPLPIVGLTGGIATGKSSVSKILEKKGLALIDADQLVKEIYLMPETIDFIRDLSPNSLSDSKIDFKKLREHFFSSHLVKEQIEGFIYQRLPEVFNQKLNTFVENGHKFIFYDVPLLFEKGLDSKLDLTCTVYASAETQLSRLIKRDNINEELAKSIIAHQMDIEKKKKLSTYTIDNTNNIKDLEQFVTNFLSYICS